MCPAGCSCRRPAASSVSTWPSPSPTARHVPSGAPATTPSVPTSARRAEPRSARSPNLGRLIRFSPVDLPVAPENSIQLGAGRKVDEYIAIAIANRKERVLALVSLDSADSIALGTRQGVVKRLAVGTWPNRPDFEVIGLKPGDEVIGAAQGPESDELVFVSSLAQLLHFPAALVRPQGAAAGGVAGMNLGAKDAAIFFTSLDPAASVVATVSTNSTTLAGTDAGRAKVSDFSEFPGKGRATGGVRAHAFLKGEDALALAWAGPSAALAVAQDGGARQLPDSGMKRDSSGLPLDSPVASIGRAIQQA